MTDFNSTIVVDSKGVDDFVKGLKQTESELKQIESQLAKLGVPQDKLRQNALAYKNTMLKGVDSIDKAQKTAFKKQESRLKKLAKSSGGVGREALGTFIGGGLGETFGIIQAGLADIVDGASDSETELKAIGAAVDTFGTKLTIVGKDFLTAFSGPIEKSLEFITTAFFKLQAGIEVIYEELKRALSALTDGFSEDSLLVKGFTLLSEFLSNLPAVIAGSVAAMVEFAKLTGRAFEEVGLSIQAFALEARLAISTLTREDVGALEKQLAAVNAQLKANTVQISDVGAAYDKAYNEATKRAGELEKANDEAAQKAIKRQKAEEAAEKARQRRLEKINALKAESSVIDALVAEEQDKFQGSISTGDIKGAEQSFKGLEDILEALEDSIKDIENAITVTGDVTQESLIKSEAVAEDLEKSYMDLVDETEILGNTYSAVVNKFIETDPKLSDRNPFLLGLQKLVDEGKIAESTMEAFLSKFTDKNGLINVFNQSGKGVEIADENLKGYIQSLGVTGGAFEQISEDGVNAFHGLIDISSEAYQKAREARAAADKQEEAFNKQNNKRRKEQADREKELIALRRKRDSISKQLNDNNEAITKVELDRINQIRTAYEESAFSIFELLIKLGKVKPEDALKDFALRRDAALDGVAERSLKSIQAINDLLAAKDLGELSFSIDKTTGAAFIEGLTDDIRAANPILIKEVQVIIDEYNLLLESFAQDSERLSLETADRIAQGIRAISALSLRDIKLELQLSKGGSDELTKELQSNIQDSLDRVDLNIEQTISENTVIRNAGDELIKLEGVQFDLRKDRLKLFYDDAIRAAELANEDTTLLVKERQIAVENSERVHSNNIKAINKNTTDSIQANNRKLLDDTLSAANAIADSTVSLVTSIGSILDSISEGAIGAISSQIDVLNEELSNTVSNIDALESDLEGKREGRREALLRGIDLEKERQESLTKKKIEQEKKLEAEETRQSNRRKAAATSQALINGALAVTNVWANNTIPYPAALAFNIPQTAALGAITIAEVAAINTQQFADGAILEGNSHANGGIPFTIGGVSGFEAEGGEAIINKKSTSMYKPLLSAINEAGGGKKFQQGAVLGADFSAMNVATGGFSKSDLMELLNKEVFVSVTDIQNVSQRQATVTDRSSI